MNESVRGHEPIGLHISNRAVRIGMYHLLLGRGVNVPSSHEYLFRSIGDPFGFPFTRTLMDMVLIDQPYFGT
jgi:hypothetical protein